MLVVVHALRLMRDAVCSIHEDVTRSMSVMLLVRHPWASFHSQRSSSNTFYAAYEYPLWAPANDLFKNDSFHKVIFLS